jgi:hypothetical protein
MARLILTRNNKPMKSRFHPGTRMWIDSGPECDIRINPEAGTLVSITHRDKRYVLSNSVPDRQLRANHGYAKTGNPVDRDVIHLDDYKLLFSEFTQVPADAWPAGR